MTDVPVNQDDVRPIAGTARRESVFGPHGEVSTDAYRDAEAMCRRYSIPEH